MERMTVNWFRGLWDQCEARDGCRYEGYIDSVLNSAHKNKLLNGRSYVRKEAMQMKENRIIQVKFWSAVEGKRGFFLYREVFA